MKLPINRYKSTNVQQIKCEDRMLKWATPDQIKASVSSLAPRTKPPIRKVKVSVFMKNDESTKQLRTEHFTIYGEVECIELPSQFYQQLSSVLLICSWIIYINTMSYRRWRHSGLSIIKLDLPIELPIGKLQYLIYK